MKRTEKGYILSTGREVNPHEGILGICPGDKALYDGYDGRDFDPYSGAGDDELTPEERSEIASFMSALWLQWAHR
jgi:hypothetical protein